MGRLSLGFLWLRMLGAHWTTGFIVILGSAKQLMVWLSGLVAPELNRAPRRIENAASRDKDEHHHKTRRNRDIDAPNIKQF